MVNPSVGWVDSVKAGKVRSLGVGPVLARPSQTVKAGCPRAHAKPQAAKSTRLLTPSPRPRILERPLLTQKPAARDTPMSDPKDYSQDRAGARTDLTDNALE